MGREIMASRGRRRSRSLPSQKGDGPVPLRKHRRHSTSRRPLSPASSTGSSSSLPGRRGGRHTPDYVRYGQLAGVTVSVPHAVLQYGRTELVVAYQVQAVSADGSVSRHTYRFSEFEGMHRQLAAPALERLGTAGHTIAMVAAGLSGLPAFPGRSGLFQASTNTSLRMVERRRGELQTYLRRLCAVAHGTPLAPAVADFLALGTSDDSVVELPPTHQGQVVVRTRWCTMAPPVLMGGTLRVELPWARQTGSRGECVVDSVKGESLAVVRKRFREFASFLNWVPAHDDHVPTCKDALAFLAAFRKSTLSGVPVRVPLPGPHPRAATPPSRLGLLESSNFRALPGSAPDRDFHTLQLAHHAGGPVPDFPQVVVTPPPEGDGDELLSPARLARRRERQMRKLSGAEQRLRQREQRGEWGQCADDAARSLPAAAAPAAVRAPPAARPKASPRTRPAPPSPPPLPPSPPLVQEDEQGREEGSSSPGAESTDSSGSVGPELEGPPMRCPRSEPIRITPAEEVH
eukprot:TRINITY_DN1307_c0_g1_i1.p2 TRINITY_DN1307_c0_g1~~TRINITY_DN1307_c0_g1_i1.p2  ORF type:complete len:517 (+),score=115.60 TRINITY_DN1307_c0_g1_i1:81-1631(+)